MGQTIEFSQAAVNAGYLPANIQAGKKYACRVYDELYTPIDARRVKLKNDLGADVEILIDKSVLDTATLEAK